MKRSLKLLIFFGLALAATAAGALAIRAHANVSCLYGAVVCGANNSSGVGVEGEASSTFAIAGRTWAAGSSLSSYYSGVWGYVNTSDPYNVGAYGESLNGNGINGFTDNTNTSVLRAGIFGGAPSSSSGATDAGVWGVSQYGAGVVGASTNAIGALFESAASASTTKTPLWNPAVLLEAPAKGYAITAASFTSLGGKLTPILSLDGGGNVTIKGKLVQHRTPHVVMPTLSGREVVAYGTTRTTPGIEDEGEARLTYGYARVLLDRGFAQTLDRTKPYLVFLTPEGMTGGVLCVVERDAYGFTVRENLAGHSTVAFAYRIVGTPLGEAGTERLPEYTPDPGAASRINPLSSVPKAVGQRP